MNDNKNGKWIGWWLSNGRDVECNLYELDDGRYNLHVRVGKFNDCFTNMKTEQENRDAIVSIMKSRESGLWRERQVNMAVCPWCKTADDVEVDDDEDNYHQGFSVFGACGSCGAQGPSVRVCNMSTEDFDLESKKLEAAKLWGLVEESERQELKTV